MITPEDMAGIEERFMQLTDADRERVRALVNDPAAPILAYLLDIPREQFDSLVSQLRTQRRGLAARQR